MRDADPEDLSTEEIMATQTATQPTRARPVHEVRLGAIRASIWANETENGIRHNVTFDRTYRDGETWKSTTSFGRDDLLVLAKAADQAHTWIISQPRDHSEPGVTPENKPARRSTGSLDKASLPSQRP